MNDRTAHTPPLLPLVLWRTPPSLAMVLAQEGIAFVELEHGPAAMARAGRFVLHDGRREPRRRVEPLLAKDQSAFDIDVLRRGCDVDPFAALLDTRARPARWSIGGHALRERVNRHDRAAIRAKLMDAIRGWVEGRGGVWARLAPFPYPYRSAFNLRVDLDEPCEDDYFRFAAARRPIEDCTTHFVSTAAYGGLPRVLADLRGLDVQSHGHHHVVYRDPSANRRNLAHADAILRKEGFSPRAFAAPEGRWNFGLDDAIEALGYGYSSEFQVGFDDLPFFAWRGDRASRVLQVPTHPICEGLFLNAGARDGRAAAEHLAGIVRSRVDAGEPAFVYGHPEGRLGRYPEIVEAVASAALESPLVWRLTLGEFASWWRWRLARRWTLSREDGALRVDLENPGREYTPVLEIGRGSHVASVPLRDGVTRLKMEALAYRRTTRRVDGPHAPHALSVPRPRQLVRTCLTHLMDWETVTPLGELPDRTSAERWKKRLRGWLAGRRGGRR